MTISDTIWAWLHSVLSQAFWPSVVSNHSTWSTVKYDAIFWNDNIERVNTVAAEDEGSALIIPNLTTAHGSKPVQSTSHPHYIIWDSQSCYDIDAGLLGCNAAWTCRQIPTFRRTHCFHLQGWCSSENYIPTNPHSVTTRKTNIDIFTGVGTSQFKCHRFFTRRT
jgi:hypothetical protein